MGRKFLDPVLALPDEACFTLLRSFVFNLSARGVMDPPAVSPAALALLRLCADRVSKADELSSRNHGTGSWSRDLGPLLKDLLFVSIDDATLAARFANGDYTDLSTIMPIVDSVAPAAVRSLAGLSAYLTLCERSSTRFPTGAFVKMISGILGDEPAAPHDWSGTILPGRIAALLHDFAERDSPLTPELARAMLAILDALVDIGDRRSAALQTNQIFRETRIG